MAESNEVVLKVPAELTRKFKGLCMDMGSSVLKFVYRSKEDKEEVADEGVRYGHLRLVSFGKDDREKALDYVLDRADIRRVGDEPPTLCTTGAGCTDFGKYICEKLNIKVDQLTEFDCFVKSFVYLAARLSRRDLLEPYLDEAVVEPLEATKQLAVLMQQMQDNKLTEGSMMPNESAFTANLERAVCRPSEAALAAGDVPLTEAETDVFPCLLAMCGSGFGFFKIEKDGKFSVGETSNRGGRAFLGMGSLLTGCQSYNELLDLAAAGDARTVDQMSSDLTKDIGNASEGDSSMYTKSTIVSDTLVFCFGKAIGKKHGELKREDVARAWLNFIILDLVQTAHSACIMNDVKRLFFCGSFCNHPLVRSIITTEYARRNLMKLSFAGTSNFVPFDFIKPGPHLGALGCVVSDAQKSTDSK